MLQFLKLAVRDRLQQTLFGDGKPLLPKSGQCELTEANGQPIPPFNAPVVIAIHGGSLNRVSPDTHFGLAEEMSFSVTVSVKRAHVPKFRSGDITISNASDGVEWLCEYIIGALHGYLALASDANALATLAGIDRGEFIAGEPPLFSDADEVIERDGSWWGVNIENKGSIYGASCRMTFTGIHLRRYIGDIAPS